MSTLERAIAIAAEAHAGQVDKAGFPYILHPVRVMSAMESFDGQIVGVLHDVIEDCPAWSFEKLAAEGFKTDVLIALNWLTRTEGLSYERYIDRIVQRATPLAQAVKVADLRDNLSLGRIAHLPGEQQRRLEAKYRPALQRLIECPHTGGL